MARPGDIWTSKAQAWQQVRRWPTYGSEPNALTPVIGPMSAPRPILERAFELAGSGECAGTDDIRAKLKAEGYTGVDEQLYGRLLKRQLQELCKRTCNESWPLPAQGREGFYFLKKARQREPLAGAVTKTDGPRTTD